MKMKRQYYGYDASRPLTRVALSQINHGLTCQERTNLVVPGEPSMQTRARRDMMLGVASFNFSEASRMGIVIQ